MSPLVTYLLVAAAALFAALIIVELLTTRAIQRFIVQAIGLTAVILLLHYTTDFPQPRRQFGGASILVLVGGMFACVVLGMIARYFFYMRRPFSWRSFLKPLFVSPIVLLPLLGTVQSAAEIEVMQSISFGVLAFQNGFFWQVVFDNARSNA